MGDAFSVPFILSCLGVMLLPPGRDASPSQGYPSAVCRRYPFIHLREERQSGVKSLSKETTRRARLEPQASSKADRQTISITRLLIMSGAKKVVDIV